MAGAGEIRILVAGFGAFPGARRNPSAALVIRLGRMQRRLARLGNVRIAIETLPVTWRQARLKLHESAARLRPHAILLVGLAGRRSVLTIESRALNRRSLLHADAEKRVSTRRALAPQGPFVRPARAPLARLIAALRRAGNPARISIDAGDYLCNEAFYAALETETALVCFIHVPPPRAPRKRGSDLTKRAGRPEGAFSSSSDPRRRRPSLGEMADGLFACLSPLMAELRAEFHAGPTEKA